MESNWRFHVAESGLTAWESIGATNPVYRWRYIARLAVPLPYPFNLYQAVGLLEAFGSTYIYAFSLDEGGYPFPGPWIGDPPGTHFPGSAIVWPDQPAVPWA